MKINELKAVVVCGTEYPGGRERATERVCNEERAGSQHRTDAGWLCGSYRMYKFLSSQAIPNVKPCQYTQIIEKNLTSFSQKTHSAFIHINRIF